MKKDHEIFEIGNGVWCGKLVVGYENNKNKDKPMYREFFGLSKQSVNDKIKEYKKGLSQWRFEKEKRSAV